MRVRPVVENSAFYISFGYEPVDNRSLKRKRRIAEPESPVFSTPFACASGFYSLFQQAAMSEMFQASRVPSGALHK